MNNVYQSQKPPYPHQAEALRRLEGQKNFALFMYMRTGKTKVLLDDFGRLELEGKVQDLLVIAPAGVYRTWEKAIKDHCSDDLQSRLLVFTFQSGMTKTQKNSLKKFRDTLDRPRVLLMNVEAISRPSDARELCVEFLSQRASMCVVDESVIIKNPNAKCTKFIVKRLSQLPAYKRILSGLPTPRNPLDIYSQMEFLDWNILGYRQFTTFRARFAKIEYSCLMKYEDLLKLWYRRTNGQHFSGTRDELIAALVQRGIWFQKIPKITGYQNQDELRKLIEPFSYRVEFRPKIPSTYTIYEVKFHKEQERIYNELRDYCTSQIKGEQYVTSTMVITHILRLHQILCGHTYDESGQVHEVPENRTEALLELLEPYNGKAIIWCSYDRDVRKISEALIKEYGEGSVARFWGGNVKTREQEEIEFKTNLNCRFMIATPDAGRFGRTWDNADLVIFYSSKNNLDHRDQAEMRPLGVNKEKQVDYIDLIVPGTVETKILEALRKKIDMASVINGDNYREWLI